MKLHLILFAWLGVLCASCVMPGDIADLKEANARWQLESAEDLRMLEAGVLSRADYDAREAERQRRYEESVEAVKETVEARTEDAWTAGKGLLPGGPLVDVLATLGLGGFAVYKKAKADTNRERDERRKQREEPV